MAIPRKVNDNGMPPGHPNEPSPGLGGIPSVADTAEDLAHVEALARRHMGLNEFTRRSPWFRGGNDENQS